MSESEEGRPTSDFVKKLYIILEDDSVKHIVCWGPDGDSFVIHDTNEFAKTVLPKMFKHSNFASFVRQLNKYDFHKVKNTADKSGEHSWTFRHAKFTRLNRDNAVDTIKRKATVPRKFIAGADSAWNSNHVEGTSCWGAFQLRASPEDTSDSSRSASYDAPERCQVYRGHVVAEGADELRKRIMDLERDYRSLVEEYRKDMGRQQRLIQRLVAHFEETRGESQECKRAPLESGTGQDVPHAKLQCGLYGNPSDGKARAQHDQVRCGMSDFLSIPPILRDSTKGSSSVVSGSSFYDDEGWYHFRGRMGRGQLSGTDEEMVEVEGPRSILSIVSPTPPLSMSATSGSPSQFEFGTELVPVNGINYDTTSPLNSEFATSPCEPPTYAEQRVGGWDDWTFDTTSLALAASPMQRGLGIRGMGEPENHSGAISMGVS